jgi:hypothetical protein
MRLSGSFRGSRNQVIEIDGFTPEIGAQTDYVAFVANDIIELVLPVQTRDGQRLDYQGQSRRFYQFG